MKNRVVIAVVITGFSGLVGQMILLRELLIVCSGNEFSIGIILANWLILEAFGSFVVGKRAESSLSPLVSYAWFTILFSLALPAMIYAARMMRTVLGISIAQGIGILPILGGSFIILLPVSILHGALFTYGCKVYASYTETNAATAGKAYVFETAGTLLGGIAWTFLLIPYVHNWHTAAGIAAANFLICTLLLFPEALRKTGRYRVGAAASLVLCVLTAGAVIGGFIDRLHWQSAERQWQPQNLVHYENTKYSNIGVIEREGQYTLFLDGLPHIVTPIPDILEIEEFVHIPMLAHRHPANVLILSRGAGGVINEVLKHPVVEHIDYAEMDPKVIELLRTYRTSLIEQELDDPRVQVSHTDGRLFLNQAETDYDVIMVGIEEPSDLQSNRYFTHEFFTLASERLGEEGILVFTVPGSLTYLSEELRNLNGTIYHTVTDVFPHVRVIPGEGSNLFLASQSDEIIAMDVDRFSQRTMERNIAPDVLVPRHIRNKLHPGWMKWYEEFIKGSADRHNRDFSPIGVYYTISHWNAVFTPALRGTFSWLGELDLGRTAVFFAAAAAVILTVRMRKPDYFGTGIPMTIGTTGFTGMIFDLALIFAFQAIYGYVFSWIGLLVAAFMAGSALGAMGITACLPKVRKPRKLLVIIDLIIMGYALLLPFIFRVLQPYAAGTDTAQVFRGIILFLSCISGALIGAQFPLANRIYLQERGNLSRTVGLMYGSDLFGGWIGGIVGGVILLPVLGFLGTCVTAVLLKICSFTVLTTQKGEAVQVSY